MKVQGWLIAYFPIGTSCAKAYISSISTHLSKGLGFVFFSNFLLLMIIWISCLVAICENVSITLYILVVGIFEVCEDLVLNLCIVP